MAQVGRIAAETLLGLLRSSTGLGNALAKISTRESVQIPLPGQSQMFVQNVSSDIAEKSQTFRYPALYVYCDKVSNLLRERFRRFSGSARLNIEIRVSQDRLEGLEERLQLYVDAVTEVLHESQGSWDGKMCYAKGYEIQFTSAKFGGRTYI